MENKINGVKAIDSLIQFAYQMGIEVYYGIRYKRVPLIPCLFVGFFTNLCVVEHWDYRLFQKYHIDAFYPLNPKIYWPYYAFSTTTGFWLWAMYRAQKRGKRKKELEDAFRSVGLKSHTNKTPQLIWEHEILPGVFRLELRAPGFTRERFEGLRGDLQTHLGIFIDEVKENIERRSIEIIYAKKGLDHPYKAPSYLGMAHGTFIVGMSRAKQVRGDLLLVPHLLIAGETNGGKSTFQRQFVTTLYLNNPRYEFLLIDLKEGLEFQIFENLPRVTVVTDVIKAITELAKFPEILKKRMETIRNARCVDLPGYLTKYGERAELSRFVIVIDEAAELFLSGLGRKSQETTLVRRAVSQIARQGRAVGIHIVLATQRPDVKTIDAQVKANLPGAICFQTPNNETSITALGNGKATHLPAIKGRALWKMGSQLTEVQTPYLEKEEAEALIKDRKEDKVGNPTTTRPVGSLDCPKDQRLHKYVPPTTEEANK